MYVEKNRVITFTLPGQVAEMNEFLERKELQITDKKVVPCSKDALILVYIEYTELELEDE